MESGTNKQENIDERKERKLDKGRRFISGKSLADLLRWRLSDTQRYMLLWIVAGLACGVVAVAFHLAISGAYEGGIAIAHGFESRFGPWAFVTFMVLAPVLGGLVAGLVATYVCPEVKGSGIPQTKIAYFQNFGIIPLRVAFWRFVVGTISVGSGNSLGREGPTVHICSAVASSIGQAFGLAKKRVQAMVPVGMGAGIAAAFNTPLAAMFFVFEALLGDVSTKALFGILVAVVIAASVERVFLGENPAFAIDLPMFETSLWMLMAIPLAIATALLGHLFVRSLLRVRAFFKRIDWCPACIKPAIGGLGVGIIGVSVYLLTQREHLGIFATGYGDLSSTLNGQLTALGVLTLLLVGKVIATILAFASSGSGGIFSPCLFIGAMVGAIIGVSGQMVFGYGTNEIAALALLGMGAFLAAVIQAPITSIVIIFELTQQYALILPLMVGNILAWFISNRLRPLSIYDEIFVQDKISLKKFTNYQGDQDWRNLPVSTIMTFDVITVPAGKTPTDILKGLEVRKHAYPVVSERGLLEGVITHHELEERRSAGVNEPIIKHLPDHDLVMLSPDTSIRDVANTLVIEDVLQAPIVQQTPDGARVIGVITLHDIARQQNAISEGIER